MPSSHLTAVEFLQDALNFLLNELESESGPYIHAAGTLQRIAKGIATRSRSLVVRGEDATNDQGLINGFETSVIDVLAKATSENDEASAEAAIRLAAKNLGSVLQALESRSDRVVLSATAKSAGTSTAVAVGVALSSKDNQSAGVGIDTGWLESVEDWAEFLFRLTMVEREALILLEQPRVESLREFLAAKRSKVFAADRPFVVTGKQQPAQLSEGDATLGAKHVEALRQRYQQVFERFPVRSIPVSPLWKAWLRAVHGPTLEAWTNELREAVR